MAGLFCFEAGKAQKFLAKLAKRFIIYSISLNNLMIVKKNFVLNVLFKHKGKNGFSQRNAKYCVYK